MSKDIDTKTHVECPHCGHVQTHEECGTYQVLLPACVSCHECTEVGPQNNTEREDNE